MKLSGPAASALYDAMTWATAGERFEMVNSLGDIPTGDLAAAVEVLVDVLEPTRRLRDAKLARGEAS